MSKRIISLLIALVLALACLGGFSAMAEEVPTITISRDLATTEPKSVWFDWALNTTLMFRTLLAADSTMAIVGCDLAESYEVSEDGLTVTVVLKDGLKWSDGEALTMDDVVWSFETAKIAEINAVYGAAFGYIEDLSAEGNVLTIKLSQPYVDFLATLAQFAILPQHCFTECEQVEVSNYAPYWEFNPVCSGIMCQTEIVQDEYTVLEPNPYYEGAAPKIQKIIVKCTSDLAVEAQAGALDLFATMSADVYGVVSELPNYTITNADFLYFRYLLFNVSGMDGNVNEFMNNEKIRRAIAYAVDWKSLIESAFEDRAEVTTTGVQTSDPTYIGDQYSYDPEMAKQLLEEGGYDFNHEFRLLYYYTDQTTVDMMDAIVYYLSEVGIKAKATLSQDVVADIYELRDYDMVYCGLASFSNLNWYQEYIDAAYMGKLIAPATEEFAELMSKLLVSFDEAETAELYTQLQKLEAEKCYKFPACNLKFQFYNSKRLALPETCVFGNVTYHYDMDFANWEVVDA